MAHSGELYSANLCLFVETLWGEGWISPGGGDEVDRVLEGINVDGKKILDIGSGLGGADFHLVTRRRAAHVTGIDVENTVVSLATTRARAKGLSERTEFRLVAPGPLEFPDQHFDIVFSRDAIVHIPDKVALMRDVFRVLKPGGWFVGSDWLISHDNEPSEEMKTYLVAEGLDFTLATPAALCAAMASAGFVEPRVTIRNDWYCDVARREIEQLSGPLYTALVKKLGEPFVLRNIDIWKKMLVVLDTGELHVAAHTRAHRPH